jgi:hypothetical protein
MSQTFTLDEAADKLNLSVEEFKRRLRGEWAQKVHVFRDGSTLRFRAGEIEELARSIGLGSSDELPMAESSPLDLPSDIGLAPPAKAPSTHLDPNAPLRLDDSDEVFLLAPDASGKPSSKKLKGRSDSDVRLEKAPKTSAADDEESILTEEVQRVGEGGSGKLSGKSGKLTAAQLKSGDSGKHKPPETGKAKSSDSSKVRAAAAKPVEDDSSEFELTLDADSDEFELSLAPDSSEEVALGEMPTESPSGKSGNSGINLNRPADSGVSLEKRKAKGDEEEVDFELSLEAPGSGSSRKKLGSGSKIKPDSDSEFELTLEEPSDLAADVTTDAPAADKKGDIFEATDFEIPALEDDSASEAVSLDEADTDLESSDFDLALDEADVSADDESASEVVAIADRDVSKAKAKRRKKIDDDDDGAVDLGDDLEDGPSASKALRGVRRGEDDDDDYEVSESVEDEEGRPVAVAAPAKWGPLPAILMFPTVIILFLGGLMAYELLHSVWGYQQAAKPTTPLVSWFAETTGMKTAQ